MKLVVLSTKVPQDLAHLVANDAAKEGLTISMWLRNLAKNAVTEA
jgi:hypothetical protein